MGGSFSLQFEDVASIFPSPYWQYIGVAPCLPSSSHLRLWHVRAMIYRIVYRQPWWKTSSLCAAMAHIRTSPWVSQWLCSDVTLCTSWWLLITLASREESEGNALVYVCLSVCMSVCLSVWLYVCLYICMFVCLYVCLFVCLSVCLSVCLYVCLYVCMSVCLSVCMSVCLSVCLYVCMGVCLSVRTRN